MYCFPCLALPLPTRYPYPCLSRHRPPFYSLGKCCPLFSSVSLFHKNLDKYVCIACTAFHFHFYSFPSLLEEKHLGFSLSQFSSLFYYSFFTLHDGTQWSTFLLLYPPPLPLFIHFAIQFIFIFSGNNRFRLALSRD